MASKAVLIAGLAYALIPSFSDAHHGTECGNPVNISIGSYSGVFFVYSGWCMGTHWGNCVRILEGTGTGRPTQLVSLSSSYWSFSTNNIRTYSDIGYIYVYQSQALSSGHYREDNYSQVGYNINAPTAGCLDTGIFVKNHIDPEFQLARVDRLVTNGSTQYRNITAWHHSANRKSATFPAFDFVHYDRHYSCSRFGPIPRVYYYLGRRSALSRAWVFPRPACQVTAVAPATLTATGSSYNATTQCDLNGNCPHTNHCTYVDCEGTLGSNWKCNPSNAASGQVTCSNPCEPNPCGGADCVSSNYNTFGCVQECGDGAVIGGEECDDGGPSATCNGG
jgi:hypothetical protein